MADDMSTAKEVYEATQAVCAASLSLNSANYAVEDAEKLPGGSIEQTTQLCRAISTKVVYVKQLAAAELYLTIVTDEYY